MEKTQEDVTWLESKSVAHLETVLAIKWTVENINVLADDARMNSEKYPSDVGQFHLDLRVEDDGVSVGVTHRCQEQQPSPFSLVCDFQIGSKRFDPRGKKTNVSGRVAVDVCELKDLKSLATNNAVIIKLLVKKLMQKCVLSASATSAPQLDKSYNGGGQKEPNHYAMSSCERLIPMIDVGNLSDAQRGHDAQDTSAETVMASDMDTSVCPESGATSQLTEKHVDSSVVKIIKKEGGPDLDPIFLSAKEIFFGYFRASCESLSFDNMLRIRSLCNYSKEKRFNVVKPLLKFEEVKVGTSGKFIFLMLKCEDQFAQKIKDKVGFSRATYGFRKIGEQLMVVRATCKSEDDCRQKKRLILERPSLRGMKLKIQEMSGPEAEKVYAKCVRKFSSIRDGSYQSCEVQD